MSVESMEDRLFIHRNFPSNPLLGLLHLMQGSDLVLGKNLSIDKEFKDYDIENGKKADDILMQVGENPDLLPQFFEGCTLQDLDVVLTDEEDMV